VERSKKECILDAAARAFARLGFKKASVDGIAREAGVAKGTVYLACESKEDLFYQAVHRDLRAWLGEVARMIDPRAAADDLLERVARTGIAYLDGHPLVKDLFTGIYHGQLPGWADRFEELRSLGHTNVVEILELGIRQGIFRSDLDVEETARVLQDLHVAGIMQRSRAQRSPAELERAVRAGLDLVLNGLRTRGAAA
jgi:AcrR family transcriptional regulator